MESRKLQKARFGADSSQVRPLLKRYFHRTAKLRNNFETDMLVQGFNQLIRISAYLEIPVGYPSDEMVYELFDCVPCGLRVMTCADVARGCIDYSRNKDQTFAE